MSYQVLARKWRPRSFKTMVGQDTILRMLQNALEQQRIHHAYLFTGTRGVGKTTLARIMAKCLNCETGITPTPCDHCANCKAIDAGQFLDLFEIDAASRTKVEDTRELLDNVLYPPTQGRYKVYLIDEVHMLSNSSFNALLKTLEEPPAHIVFLFATTDPKKLPVTILSRCLQFHLSRITVEQITNHLQFICTQENVSHEAAALTAIARAADGSLRDALSLLDQAIAYGHGQLTSSDVNTLLGNVSQEDLLPLLQALANQDSQAAMNAVNHLADCVPDYQRLLEDMIHLFHQIAMAQVLPDLPAPADIIKQLAHQIAPGDVQVYYQIALLGRRDLSYSPDPLQGFEMLILRMLAFLPSVGTQPEQQTSQRVVNAPSSRPAPSRHTQSVATAPLSSVNSQTWRDILPKLGLSGMAYALAANCSLVSINGAQVELALSTSHQPMLNPKLKERLTEALGRHFNQTIQLTIQVTAEELSTPVKEQMTKNHQQLGDAKTAALNNPAIKQLVDMYDATIDISILP